MWKVTIVHGKESFVVTFPAPTGDEKWLEKLQETVAEQTNVAIAHQKLLFRGKQLSSTSLLTDGAKLMLLKNASFHKSEASKKTSEASKEEETKEMATDRVVPVSQRLGIAANDVDEDHVLVQALRGKAMYEFLFPADTVITSVKSRIGGTLGLSGAALRLIIKGKTPKDDDRLTTFVSGPRVLKCMVLLTAKQHDYLEREEEFRTLQNELTSVEADIQRLGKVMGKNVLSQEEVVLRMHAVQDQVGRLESNLEILEDQLKATKLIQDSPTLQALANAKRECDVLKTRVESMAQQWDHGR